MTQSPDLFIDACLAQSGDRYVFGAETSPLDPDPDKFDCSELVEWAAARVGISPKVPDGAYWQWKHSRPLLLSEGIKTRGALLFVGDGTGTGRDAITHVAVSLGDGTTIEARGKKWGVGTWGVDGRFDFAGLIPGLDYTQPSKPRPVNQGGGIALTPGASSGTVKFMQAMLNIVTPFALLGDRRPLEVDGEYGPRTKARVLEFERWCNGMSRLAGAKDGLLQEDGIATKHTLARLGWWVNRALGR